MAAIVNEQLGLDPDLVHLNNGSYGVTPKPVTNAIIQLCQDGNASRDIFNKLTLPTLHFKNKAMAAKFVDAPEECFGFVNNTTSGINAILSSILWQSGDVILVNNFTYPGVLAAVYDIIKRHQGVVIESYDISFPGTTLENIVYSAKTAVARVGAARIKLTILDHISSSPAIRMPVECLIPYFKSLDIMVAIDGAHVPGQLPLSVKTLQPDFYVGNFHKWLFSGIPAGFIYVSPEHIEEVRGPVVSYDFFRDNEPSSNTPSAMDRKFLWQGSSNCANFITMTHAIEFFNTYNDSKRVEKLADEMELMLTKELGFENVMLPPNIAAPRLRTLKIPGSSKLHEFSQEQLLELFRSKHGIICMFVKVNGDLYLRLSFQIYNDVDDYKKLCAALKIYC